MQFQRGQKSQLEQLGVGSRFEVGIRIAGPGGADLDLSCFGLDGAGKLSDEQYFVFYNQTRSPCGGVELKGGSGGFDKVFAIDLDRLPAKIDKLVFAATIDGSGSMSGLGRSELAVEAGGRKMTFPFDGSLFGGEKAVMIAEVYRKGVWRIAAVGQGFNGGLGALLEHFGGEVADSPPPPAPAPAPSPAPAADPPKVNLGKVTLEKRGQSQKLSLKKRGENVIHVNLNWDQQKKKRSWFGGGGNDADLDLGCFYEMVNGDRGVIQPLGGNFGNRHGSPWIELDKDDRSGAAADGENMRFYKPDAIKRVVIFAMIYEGSQNFTQVNGRVTVKDTDGNEILVNCDSPDPRLTFCAVCTIHGSSDGISITKEELYFRHHLDCDNHFGFGFRWTAGRK